MPSFAGGRLGHGQGADFLSALKASILKLPHADGAIASTGGHQRAQGIDHQSPGPVIARVRTKGCPTAAKVKSSQSVIAGQADDQVFLKTEAGVEDKGLMPAHFSNLLMGE